MNNPLAFTDPSGYLQTELLTGFRRGISYDDRGIHQEMQDGGGGAGGNANPDCGWNYIKARHDGYMGSAETFFEAWDKSATDPNFNGTFSFSEKYQSYAVNGKFANGTIEIVTIITKVTYSINIAQGGGVNYNPNVDFGLTAIGTEADIFGTAATITTVQLAKTVKGVSSVSKVATGAGIIGLATTGSVATYEYITGQANTHTLVDVGLTLVLTGVSVAGVIVSSPAIIVGSAVGGLFWGITSFSGGSDAIDSWTNNWGQRTIYGQPRGAGDTW